MLISIVIPVFNEEEIIQSTLSRINEITSFWDEESEIIYVNDGSTDKTAEIISNAAKINSKIKLLTFSRNFGHQMAFTAGLDYAKGDAVIVIDGDLQDPPELMIKFIQKWKEGYHVVYGKRVKRKGETFFKLITC